MRGKSLAWAVLALLAAGTGVGAYAVAGSGKATRPDCPGTIVCPLTGETVCRDRCPLNGDPRDTPSVSPCCGETTGPVTPNTKPAGKKGCCR